MVMKSISDWKNFVNKYKDVDNFVYYGMENHVVAFIADHFRGDVEYDTNLIRVGWIDIETTSENGFPDPFEATEQLVAVTIFTSGTYYVFGIGEYTPHDDNIIYKRFDSEEALLRAILAFWQFAAFDVVTGWYSNGFDIPFLVNRTMRLLGEEAAKKFSPYNSIFLKNAKDRNDNFVQRFVISGVSLIDYQDVYDKFGNTNPENYKLDTVAHLELGSGKLDYSEYTSLHQLYKNDYQKFMEYNVRDVGLLVEIDAKKRLMDLVFNLAYTAKVNFEDVFHQTRMWDSIIYNHLIAQNIIVPSRPETNQKTSKYAGAYVKEPVPAKYKWITSFDLESLYPSLIIQYNISPETYRGVKQLQVDDLLQGKNELYDYCLENDLTIAANGAVFERSSQGFLPVLIEKMFNERKDFKNKMKEASRNLVNAKTDAEKRKYEFEVAKYNGLQLAKKVCLNSAYGAVGNGFFRFFNTFQAEAITMSGQLAIKWIEQHINLYLNKRSGTTDRDFVIALDTDSVDGETIIYINGKKMTIAEFYYNIVTHKHNNKKDVVDVSTFNFYTKSVVGNTIVNDKITHVMKHKVKKRMYKIIIDDKSVVVTEDHSLIVKRDGELISVKPFEVKTDDIFIYINTLDTDQYQEQVYEKKNDT